MAFIEKEVLKNGLGEYLLYDSDDDLFLEDSMARIDGHYNGPDYFVMDWVKKIDIYSSQEAARQKTIFAKHFE